MSVQAGGALTYRPELDGLRAIAVLSVVFYHFGVPGLGGGFVGVDIFFVISGFLIGTILWREYCRTGRVSLRAFYLRRFRRLAPAWTVMALAVFAAGWAFLLPNDFRELGKALLAATLFAANIQFYRTAGYFDGSAEEKPLLHMWSLSLEEQFYLFLPLLLLLFVRRPRGAVIALSLIAAASLAACIVFTRSHHVAAFYLFPFRAWELLAGVLLGIAVEERRLPLGLGWAVSGLGLVLVGAGVVLIRPGESFPGIVAAVPVAGTVLLIANGQDGNTVNRLLATRPMVAVGLISYSLYLWHWPVRSFALFLLGPEPGVTARALLVGLSFALAWASWRFVERPARDPERLPPLPLAAGVVASMALLVGLGAWPFLQAGLPGRWESRVLVHADAAQDFIQDWSRCETPADGPFAGIETCALGPEGTPRVLIWGDSHLRSIKEGLDLAAHESATPALLVWRAGCPPLVGVDKRESAATRQQDADCSEANRRMARAIVGSPATAVLLVGRWSYYAEGTGTGVDSHNLIELRSQDGGRDPYATGVARTLALLDAAGKRVFVLRQVPEMPAYRSQEVARALARGEAVAPGTLEVARAEAETRQRRGTAPFLAAASQVTLIDPWPALCDETVCLAMRDGRPLYFDNNHLTNHGARALRGMFAPLWQN